MKFVIYPQHGVTQVSVVVWDAVANRELCTFVDGEFETEDQAVIDRLIDLGYEGEVYDYGGLPVGVPDPEPVIDGFDIESIREMDPEDAALMEEEALRAHAKALGIKSWHVKSIETLVAEIAEKEGA